MFPGSTLGDTGEQIQAFRAWVTIHGRFKQSDFDRPSV